MLDTGRVEQWAGKGPEHIFIAMITAAKEGN